MPGNNRVATLPTILSRWDAAVSRETTAGREYTENSREEHSTIGAYVCVCVCVYLTCACAELKGQSCCAGCSSLIQQSWLACTCVHRCSLCLSPSLLLSLSSFSYLELLSLELLSLELLSLELLSLELLSLELLSLELLSLELLSDFSLELRSLPPLPPCRPLLLLAVPGAFRCCSCCSPLNSPPFRAIALLLFPFIESKGTRTEYIPGVPWGRRNNTQ